MTVPHARSIYEIRVTVPGLLPGGQDVLEEILLASGVARSQMVEKTSNGKAQLLVYLGAKSRAQRLAASLGRLGLKGVRCGVRRLAPGDWRDRWKEDLHAFALTSTLDVVPIWDTRPRRSSKRRPLFLDTTFAFGTGLHETTRFCARLIESVCGRFSTFLDVGTGTGLLALVAARNGAHTVDLVDKLPECIDTAGQNLIRNQVRPGLLVVMDIASFRPSRRYDLVAANLITQDILRLKCKIMALVAPGGYCVISGVSLENLDAVRRAFSGGAFRCRRILHGRKWAALLYKKRMT